MTTDVNNQDKILSTIGLKHLMGSQPCYVMFYNERTFKRYVTSEYINSERRETDEFYRMNEFNLLHIHSGLRLTLTTHESYDGDTIEYKVIRMFIKTLTGKELEVSDANFSNRIFYTKDSEISFDETNKLIY